MERNTYCFQIFGREYALRALPEDAPELMGTVCLMEEGNRTLLLRQGLDLCRAEAILERWLTEACGRAAAQAGVSDKEARESALEQSRTLLWEMGMDGLLDGPFVPEKRPEKRKGKESGKEKKEKTDYSAFAIPKPKAKAKKKGRSYRHMVKTGCCALCGARAYGGGRGGTVWHHIVYRSQGGGEEADNLIELGDDFLCACHRNIHAGLISKEKVLSAKACQALA